MSWESSLAGKGSIGPRPLTWAWELQFGPRHKPRKLSSMLRRSVLVAQSLDKMTISRLEASTRTKTMQLISSMQNQVIAVWEQLSALAIQVFTLTTLTRSIRVDQAQVHIVWVSSWKFLGIETTSNLWATLRSNKTELSINPKSGNQFTSVMDNAALILKPEFSIARFSSRRLMTPFQSFSPKESTLQILLNMDRIDL